jgi:hypothetical protein
VQPAFPIRAAFYYGWGAVNSHLQAQYGIDDPVLDPSAPRRTVAQMRYAGMNAAIASWWGQGSFADVRIPALLRGADGTPLRWSLYYEPASPSPARIAADLAYLKTRYAADPNYLRVGGRPVLFVWAGGGGNSCTTTQQWVTANARYGFYLVLKVFPGYTRCRYQPSDWHEYGPANRTAVVPGHSFAVSPGFWFTGDARPRLARDPYAFDAAVKAMARSGARWQLVTTFNEWGEGTSVEPAMQWRSWTGRGRYLDLLHATLGSR